MGNYKLYDISKMAYRRAKRIDIWASVVNALCIQGTIDI